ncbi:MAG: thioredoxin family protein [Halodesulfurarchaeum sp.]
MNTKRRFVAAFVLLVVAIGALSATTLLANAGYDTHGGVKWQTDVDAARKTAAAEGKPVLMYFWSESCTYCERFDRSIEQNQALRAALDDYVLVSVKFSRTKLRKQYGVTGTPTLVVTTAEGEKVTAFVPTRKDDVAATLESAYQRWQANHTTA